jgi:hypothetical protein
MASEMPRSEIPDKPALEGLEASRGTPFGETGGHTGSTGRTRPKTTPSPSIPTAHGHPEARIIKYRLQLHGAGSHRALSAHARARISSIRWAGTTTACRPSAACRTTTGVRCDPTLPYDTGLHPATRCGAALDDQARVIQGR